MNIKTHYSKIREFIYCVNEIVEYLEHLHPFGNNHRLPENKTIKVAEFAMSLECQKHIFYQGFDSTTNIFIELIEFCKQPDSTEEIFHYKGDGTHRNKKNKLFRWMPPTCHVREEKSSVKSARKILGRGSKNSKRSTYILNVTGQDKNSYKCMHF